MTSSSPLPPLRIVVAHDNFELTRNIVRALKDAGHEVIGPYETADELLRVLQNDGPDVAITGVTLREGDGLSALIEVRDSSPVPAIIITPKRSLELVEKALEDHVMAYLVEPFDPDELIPTLRLVLGRFEQFQQLQKEAETLREVYEVRKVVERAKGILIATRSMNEDEAHCYLQKQAKDSRRKLADVAEEILKERDQSSLE